MRVLTPAYCSVRLRQAGALLRGRGCWASCIFARSSERSSRPFRWGRHVQKRDAAEAALQRVRARLAQLEQQDFQVEMQFSLPDPWSRKLFLALCRRYGLKPYRLYRQRVTTVMLKAPRPFIDQVLWPEFEELTPLFANI